MQIKRMNRNYRYRNRYEVNNMLDKSMDCIDYENNNKKGNAFKNQNMGYFSSNNMWNNQLQPSKSKLNLFKDNSTYRFNNEFYKTVQIYHKGEYIQNIDIYNGEKMETIIKKIKNILFLAGKALYRPALADEIVLRTFPFETLENLLKKGVIETNPGIIIYHNGLKYPYGSYNYYYLQNRDVFNVEFEPRLYGAGGGGISGLDFVDIDKLTKPKYLKFSRYAPKWRQVSKGLNLFGKCCNRNCKAYNNEVIHIVGINVKFDFNINKKEIKCPMCSKNFIPITMGFWKCEYQIKGEKFRNGEYQEVEINGRETKGDEFEYYDPYAKQTAFWSSLTIFIANRQKMKYGKYTI